MFAWEHCRVCDDRNTPATHEDEATPNLLWEAFNCENTPATREEGAGDSWTIVKLFASIYNQIVGLSGTLQKSSNLQRNIMNYFIQNLQLFHFIEILLFDANIYFN